MGIILGSKRESGIRVRSRVQPGHPTGWPKNGSLLTPDPNTFKPAYVGETMVGFSHSKLQKDWLLG